MVWVNYSEIFEKYPILIDGKSYKLDQIRNLEDLERKEEAISEKRKITRTINLPPDTIKWTK